MTATPLYRRWMPLLACTVLMASAHAQTAQQPLTGQMLGGMPAAQPAARPAASQSASLPTVDLTRATEAAAPAATPAEAAAEPVPFAHPARGEVGTTTRALFRLQASGQQAGPRLPILGDQASASYTRYMKSFQHEIPDFFETDVGKTNGSSRSNR